MYCDNCDQPIVNVDDDDFLSASMGPAGEWVHQRTNAPECRNEWGRLLGCTAEPTFEASR